LGKKKKRPAPEDKRKSPMGPVAARKCQTALSLEKKGGRSRSFDNRKGILGKKKKKKNRIS